MTEPNQKIHDAAQQGATQRNCKKIQRDALYAYLFPDKRLSIRQIKAIELLLRGMSDAQVAAELQVDRGTVFRWRKDENFARELDRQGRILIEQSTARMRRLLDPALNILEKQLESSDPKTQLRAAAILVRMATPGRLASYSAAEELAEEIAAESKEHMDRVEAFVNAPLPPGNITKQESVKLR
jgi:transposase